MTRLLVVLLVIYCCTAGVAHLRAPTGWFVNGARPDGSYELAPVLGRPQDDLEDARASRAIPGPMPVQGWLWCTSGLIVQQDGLSVWCARP